MAKQTVPAWTLLMTTTVISYCLPRTNGRLVEISRLGQVIARIDERLVLAAGGPLRSPARNAISAR
jgi:hypothetical protein